MVPALPVRMAAASRREPMAAVPPVSSTNRQISPAAAPITRGYVAGRRGDRGQARPPSVSTSIRTPCASRCGWRQQSLVLRVHGRAPEREVPGRDLQGKATGTIHRTEPVHENSGVSRRHPRLASAMTTEVRSDDLTVTWPTATTAPLQLRRRPMVRAGARELGTAASAEVACRHGQHVRVTGGAHSGGQLPPLRRRPRPVLAGSTGSGSVRCRFRTRRPVQRRFAGITATVRSVHAALVFISRFGKLNLCVLI